MFISKGRVESWPFAGPMFGKAYEPFEPVGKYQLSQMGDEFMVREIGKVNYRGGADEGIMFESLFDAVAYINDGLDNV